MEPFIGQVMMFGGNFAPRGWAFCNGQLLDINSHSALFSILGVTYGGDGRTTFGLPDLRGRVPVHAGNGPGLSDYNIGQKGGVESVQLSERNMPHDDSYVAVKDGNSQPYSSTHKYFASATANKLFNAAPGTAANNAGVLGTGDGNLPHENRQPYQCINFIIALEGLYPSRS